MTPLMFAAKQGNYDVVRTLVDNRRAAANANIVENASLSAINFRIIPSACIILG